MRRHLRPVAALIALTGAAEAGGWTQPEGASYAKVWGRVLKGDRGYLANGEGAELHLGRPGDVLVPAPYLDTSLNVYVEYGLLDGTTLIASGVPYGRAKVGDEVAHFVGPLGLGARQRLVVAGPAHVAVEGRYAWSPGVGSDVLASGFSEAGDWFYQPAIEGHRGDAELQVGVGLPAGLWCAASGGGRVTSYRGVDPALLAGGQIGWASSFGLVLDLHVALYAPLGEVEAPANVAGTGQTRYVGMGLAASWWFTPAWAVTIGADGAAWTRANAAAAPLLIGIERRGGRQPSPAP